MRLLISALMVFWLACAPAGAVDPDEPLADATLEARARALSKELRCVVCQSQSIDDSDAPLARDLRLLVRERLTAGDTDAEVLAYVEDRYGSYVRLKPPLSGATLFLWLAPAGLLVLAAMSGALFLRRRAHAGGDAAPRPLTSAEEEKIRQLIGGENAGGESNNS